MKKQLWGLCFITLSALVILQYFKVVPSIPLMLIIITGFLFNWFVQSIRGRQLFGIFASCVIGFLVYNHEFQLVNIPNWTVILSATLAYIGVNMLFEQRQPKKIHIHKKTKNKIILDSHDFKEIDSQDTHDAQSRHYNHTIFASTTEYINTNVDYMSFTCLFGESKIFFDNAKMEDDQAYIHVNATFGEINLFIPKNWQVINKVSCFLGETTQAQHPNTFEKTLIIEGSVQFAQLNIVYI
ncbi:hypothetical protein KG090_01705 [Carnobacteriaceae bacterium zg-ZUI240]|nr:hypothetical protein [Carnobacteriaceae bacterium zg-ZUI240]